MKRFVIGDTHGAAKALEQCLERCGFNKEEDQLITLGDHCDGWSYVYELIELLLTIPNRIDIEGNHDWWFKQWMLSGIHPVRWKHGGIATAKSYGKLLDNFMSVQQYDHNEDGNPAYMVNLNPEDIPPTHQGFFRQQNLYYVDDYNNCFVHGGFNRHEFIKGQRSEVLLWDRDLFSSAMTHNEIHKPFKMKDQFHRVFIGHTATTNWFKNEKRTRNGIIIAKVKDQITLPLRAANIVNLDTGAGFLGKLTIMDVDTEEFWQSDYVKELYPGEKGR